MSDHGMTYGSDSRLAGGAGRVSVKKVHMGRLLRRVSSKVRRVVGSGAYAMVWPRDERFAQDIVFELRRHAGQDYQVYTKEELPEHLHWEVE